MNNQALRLVILDELSTSHHHIAFFGLMRRPNVRRSVILILAAGPQQCCYLQSCSPFAFARMPRICSTE
jgi:hypothetical protein